MKKVIILVTVVFYCLLFMPIVNADSSQRNNLDLYSTAYIRVTNDKLKVNVGKTLQLKTDTKYVRKIIYVTSNEKIAKVNSKGKITGLKEGECTVFLFDRYDQNTFTRVQLTVKKAPKAKKIEKKKTVYDVYSEEEIYLMQRIVETETYCANVEAKSHVASVIFNMINEKNKRFGKTPMSVMKCKNRFCYGRKKINKSTKEAVELAFQGDTAQGCVAFHSGKWKKRFAGFNYVFTDKVGHKFYK